MQLAFKRESKSGMMGGQKLVLTATIRLSAEEQTAVEQFKLDDIVVYEKDHDAVDSRSTASLFKYVFLVPRLTVTDLVRGKSMECKSLLEILGAEERIKHAVENFSQVLERAKHFEEETVLTFTGV